MSERKREYDLEAMKRHVAKRYENIELYEGVIAEERRAIAQEEKIVKLMEEENAASE